MDVPIGNELALRRRMYGILKNITEDTLKETDNDHIEDHYERTLNITTHLFTSLKKCFQNGNYDRSVEILKFFVENRQCSKQFIWKMFTIFLQKDIASFLPILPEMTNTFINLKTLHHDEIRLVNAIHLLNQELYDKAHQEASKFDGKSMSGGLDESSLPDAAAASSALLATYKTILEYQTIQTSDDNDAFTVMMHSFELLISKNAFLPLIADSYVFILMKLDLENEAEKFIYKYLDSESAGNMGINAALHALNIVKLHMPKASQKLTVYLLEMIADRNPGHPRVLELCRQHLYLYNSRMRSHSDTESNLDFESDEGSNSYRSTRNHDSLKRCLELLFYFLDTYVNREPDSVIREGWSIMSDTMRRICQQGTDDCLQTIVKLYHRDRKRWWTYFRYQPSASLVPTDAEYLSHQGVVCYILESESHSFVTEIRKMKGSSLLKSLIQQLNHSKTKFDSRIQSILSATECVEQVPLKSQASQPHHIITPMLETPCLSKFQDIDSKVVAEEFTKFISNSKPVKGKEQYKTSACARSATTEALKLPIDELIAQRYKRRRKVLPRCSSRISRNLSSSLLLSEDSLYSYSEEDFPSVANQSIEENSSKQIPLGKNRLRSSGPPEFLSDSSLSNCQFGLMGEQGEVTNADEIKTERWKTFLSAGLWKSLAEDDSTDKKYEELSSSEEYIPNRCVNTDGDSNLSDESYSMRSEGSTLADESIIRAGYPASIASSYPSLSPASSISSIFTPKLPVASPFRRPKEVIRNEDRYRFFDLDRMSVCSSNADDVMLSVTQALAKLESDEKADEMVDSTKIATEVVASVNIEQEETLVHSTRIEQTNVILESFLPRNDTEFLDSNRYEPGIDEEYVVEADIELPHETSVSTYGRSFSRDFEASSPDMFASLSEDEDAVKCVPETQHQQIEGHVDVAEIRITEQPEEAASIFQKETPSINILPLTTPTTIEKKMKENPNSQSKTSISNHETILSLNVTARKSSSKKNKSLPTKKKNQSQKSGLSQWSINLVDRVMEESLAKESSVLQNSSSVSCSIQSAAVKSVNVAVENPVQEDSTMAVRLSEKRSLSPKPSSHDNSILVDTNKPAKIDSQNNRKSSRMFTTPRKGHVRVKDPRYWSNDEDDDSDTANPNETVKSQPKNKVSATSARRKLVKTQPKEDVSTTSAPVKVKSTKSSKGKSLKVDTPQVSATLPNSEDESADQLIEKILAENNIKVAKKTSVANKTKKKKISSKTSLLNDQPIGQEPLIVARTAEEIMKKYNLGPESVDEDKPPKKEKKKSKTDSFSATSGTKSAKSVAGHSENNTKSLSTSTGTKNGKQGRSSESIAKDLSTGTKSAKNVRHSESNIEGSSTSTGKKSTKQARHSEDNTGSKASEKIVKKRKLSSIDQRNMELIDRLLEERGLAVTPPTSKKPSKRPIAGPDAKKSEKNPPSKQRKKS